jgi:hypothetical protein
MGDEHKAEVSLHSQPFTDDTLKVQQAQIDCTACTPSSFTIVPDVSNLATK